MAWAFRILAGRNPPLIGAIFPDRAPGEDAAGQGTRLGLSTFPILLLLALPVAYIGHAFGLSF